MDVNELAAAIARQVLQQLRETPQKTCVMVLEQRDAHLAEMVRGYLGEDADLLFCGEDTAGRTPSRYILPYVTCTEMADLAAGRAQTPVQQEVLRLLLSGVPVEALEFEYKTYAETAPGPLFSLYQAYEKTLASYGLRPFAHKAPDAVRHWQNLVTAPVVEQAAQTGSACLCVRRDAVITPLAAEAAKNLNISIHRQL